MVFIKSILLMVICGSHLAYGAGKENEYVPPKECAGKTYCTIKPPDYPQERFNEMFKGSKSFPMLTPTIGVEAVNRLGDPDYKDNCESIVTFEPLYKVKIGRVWQTVVQAPDMNFVQKVRLETCSQEDGPCFASFPSLPEIKTYCKQKLSTWKFLVAADDDDGTKTVESELPVCCSCHYKSIL